jgi:Ras-related protein Rab-11A
MNVSSPALYDDNGSNSVSLDNVNKRNISMLGLNDPSARPTLNQIGQNLSNENLSFEETIKKTTYEFKIILLGSISVGKTAILNRYITNEFDEEHKCTIKIEFKSKLININNMAKAKLNIWDTCGDEKYRAITRQYYNDANGILLIYDITSRDSFDSITLWVNEIKNNSPADAILFLVGNKTDLNKQRVISYQEGKNKAEELGISFSEVSAKNGDNILLLFENISESIMGIFEKKQEINENNLSFKISEEYDENNRNEIKKKKACC